MSIAESPISVENESLEKLGLVAIQTPRNPNFNTIVRKVDLPKCAELDNYPILYREYQIGNEVRLKIEFNHSFDRLEIDEQLAALEYVFSQDWSNCKGKMIVNYGDRDPNDIEILNGIVVVMRKKYLNK